MAEAVEATATCSGCNKATNIPYTYVYPYRSFRRYYLAMGKRYRERVVHFFAGRALITLLQRLANDLT